MRVAWGIAGVLLAQLVVAAPAPSDGTFDDPQGDVDVYGAAAGQPLSSFSSIDLLQLRLADDLSRVAFSIQVASLAQRGSAEYVIGFSASTGSFSLEIIRDETVSGAVWLGQLSRREDEGRVAVAVLNPRADPTTSTIRVEVSRDLLAAGVRPLGGNERLFDISVLARAKSTGYGTTFPISDKLPDRGSAEYALQTGAVSAGPTSLSALSPVQIVNGGRDIVSFEIQAQNTGSEDSTVSMTVEAPEGWGLKLPSSLRVPSSGTMFRVHVSIPTDHVHGDLSEIVIKWTGSDGSEGVLPLGVAHTTVPLPAGHHNTLFLHSLEGRSDGFAGYLNTLSDAPREEIRPRFFNESSYLWTFELRPSLAIPMSLDLNGTPSLSLTLKPQIDFSGDIQASLAVYSLGNAPHSGGQVLATSAWVPASMEGGTPSTFAFSMPWDTNDSTVRAMDQNLALRVSAVMDNPTAIAEGFVASLQPVLVTQASEIRLPLHEYRAGESSGTTLSIRPIGQPELVAAPGGSATFQAKLYNPTDGIVSGVARAFGDGNGRVKPEAFELAAQEEGLIELVVDVPLNASEGQLYDHLIILESAEGGGSLGTLEFITRVSRASTILAQPADAPGDAPRPFAPILPVGAVAIALLAIAAFVQRRRRTRR